MREREGERERGRERAREQEREGEGATTKDEEDRKGGFGMFLCLFFWRSKVTPLHVAAATAALEGCDVWKAWQT